MGANRGDLSYDGRGNTRYHLAAIDAGFGAGHVTVRQPGCDERAELSQSMDEFASRGGRTATGKAKSLARVF